MEPKISDLFYNDIRREINGVIKVDQYDDQNVFTELNEYVVTRESLKYIDTFFERYLNSINNPTDKTGVWISGDFGSGKSHFLKTLSYLLENREVAGKTALEFFEQKISDPGILDTIEKSVKTGTKDIILFNIDSKSGETSERIVDIMMRVFNEKRGYFGDVFWIAEMEENLEDKGLFDLFKEEFLKINGNRWEEIREQYSFEQDDIIDALEKCGFQSRDASERMFESDGQNYILTPEKFVKTIKKYCDSKGKDHQVVFLIDEIGQYIGDNSHLMLNLQTVAEEFGTILRGKAWIIVTSQADIETALNGIKRKDTKQDFSKIQARFDTRISLSSANVDEVIKKRILRKKDESNEMLSLYFEEKKTILKNLISFSQGSAEMKKYRDSEEFVSVYPFVPYQFNVLQKVFEKIRTTGFTGKHLAKGERSMLNAYKESAEKYGDSDIGTLIPFYSFYDTIESFLDPVIIRTITQAGDNDNLEDFDCLILKTLFMIRHVNELQPTLDNIIVLSLTNVDEDKLSLKESVVASLNRLEKETLISKSGDTFHFLTNEEQEINREIKNIEIERHKIVRVIYEEIFNSNNICQKSYGDYKFNKSVDDKLTTSPDADLTIRFLTPRSDEYPDDSDQSTFTGEILSNVDSEDTLLFVFPKDSKFLSQIEEYLQIDAYFKRNGLNRSDELMQGILTAKKQEAERLKNSSVLAICEGVKNARVFIDRRKVDLGSVGPRERVKEGYGKLVENVYSKSNYVTKEFESENDIIRLLKTNDLEKFGLGRSETNELALNEILSYISIRDERKIPVVFSELRDHFMGKPYGWKNYTVSGLVATLFMGEDIRLRYQRTYPPLNPEEITKYLTRKENFDKVIIEIRKKTGIEIITNVKSVLRDVFDKTALPEKENDLYNLARDLFAGKREKLSEDLVKYSEESRYPGRKQIESYLGFLKEILAVSDPSAFLKKISDEKDEIFRLNAEAELPLIFFDGGQKDIFKRILDKVEGYKRNARFLTEEAKESLSQIENILASDEPYSDIKNLSHLEAIVESSLAESLAELKDEFKDQAESYKSRLRSEFSYSSVSNPDIGGSVDEAFDYLADDVGRSGDCSFIKLKIGDLSGLYKGTYREIEEMINSEKTAGPGDEKAPEIPLDIIDKTEIFRTKKTIETEEDLEEYIAEIKGRLKELLKKNKIQVI